MKFLKYLADNLFKLVLTIVGGVAVIYFVWWFLTQQMGIDLGG